LGFAARHSRECRWQEAWPVKRLLLVDDEPGTTDFIRTIAEENAWFEIRTSNRADDFKAAFLEWHPDAVILDLAMPGTDGVELLRWLAETGCKARIAIISGFDRRVLEAAGRLGEASGLIISDKLAKPIRLAAMRQALQRLANP
jgi:DNA-binding response OmpR family regulator